MGPALDIYSFGMCALEMAALEIQGNGDSGNLVTDENINKTIDSLDDVTQKDFIRKCLNKEPETRPTAKELLFHPLLFEVHSLKLLSAHCLVQSAGMYILIQLILHLFKMFSCGNFNLRRTIEPYNIIGYCCIVHLILSFYK